MPRLPPRRRGVSLTGYALMVGLIAAAALLAIGSMGRGVNHLFGNVGNALAGSGNSVASGGGGGGGGPVNAAPVNTSLPTITGTAAIGSTLSAGPGSWTGTPTPTYAYQWQRGTSNIGGATNTTYAPVAADIGQTLRVVVTATNGSGSANATSASTTAVPMIGIAISGSGYSYADGTVAANCRAYRNGGGNYAASATSGAYNLNTGLGQFTTYCDMTTDGGGWTLIHKTDRTSPNDRTNSGYNVAAMTTGTADAVAILPAAQIDALDAGGEWRMMGGGGERFYVQAAIGAMKYRATDVGVAIISYSYKYSYGASYTGGGATQNITNHGSIMCPAGTCNGSDTGHVIPARYCCGVEPWTDGLGDKGFWWNGTNFPTRYTTGTGWVR